MTSSVLFFKDIHENHRLEVGGKGLSLAYMVRHGVKVPPGFVITSKVFVDVLNLSGLQKKIDTILQNIDHKNTKKLDMISRNIRKKITSLELPLLLQKEIRIAYKKLGSPYVAVRSSATAEDGVNHAWAGQLDSYLYIHQSNFDTYIKKCWASLFTSRALFYRIEHGLRSTPVNVAVIVQKMINSDVSGIAFSVHPITGNKNHIVIEAGWGLGESIVSGSITPDMCVVEKKSKKITSYSVGHQIKGVYKSFKKHKGSIHTKIVQFSKSKGNTRKLKNIQCVYLSNKVHYLETLFKFPCDVEWAYENGRLYILQCRPITTIKSQNNDVTNRLREISGGYYSLGRWVAPMIESYAWLGWSKTLDAHNYGVFNDDPDTVVIQGYYFLHRQGAYQKLHNLFLQELRTGSISKSCEILNLAKKLSCECIRLSKDISPSVGYTEFFKAYSLLQRLRFPWMACSPLGDAGEMFLKKYALKNKLNFTTVKAGIPHHQNSLEIDKKQLYISKEKIKRKGYMFSFKDIEKQDTALARALNIYQKNTEYIGTYHFWGKGRGRNCFMRAIQEAKMTVYKSVVKNDACRTLYTRHSKVFELIARATRWRIDCAQASAQLSYALKPFLSTLARKNGLTYGDIIFLNISEIGSLYEKGGDYRAIIRDRQKGFGVFGTENKIHVATGSDLYLWGKYFGLHTLKQSKKEVMGVIGNKGFAQGIVAIVTKPSDQIKVKKGMVMVSPETTPNFLPAMGKACAFITDQGGITSHAAIVAREMHKPCIIGTQIATRILKDGDRVEVDAEQGVVRIL